MRTGKSLFGIIIILVGAALLFDNLDTETTDIPGTYWPVLLIFLGAWGWLRHGWRPSFGNVIFMTLGGIFLTQNLSDEYSFRDLWPILAIAIGGSIFLAPRRKNRGWKRARHEFGNWSPNVRQNAGPGPSSGDSDSDSGGHRGLGAATGNDTNEFFSGSERHIDGEYTGSSVNVMLAGGLLDLTAATLPEEGATLDVDVKLGGYKLRIPNDWIIDLKAEVALGEVNDSRPSVEGTRPGPTLTITGKVFMGGIEISN